MKTQFVEYKKEQESKEEESTKGLKQEENIIVYLRTQLIEKYQIFAKLEVEVILLIEKGTNFPMFEDSLRILDDILNCQRTSCENIGLDYVHKQPNKYLKYKVQKKWWYSKNLCSCSKTCL